MSKRKPQPKSIWEPLFCGDEAGRLAVKSCFVGLADVMEGPIKANILVRRAGRKTLKVRALFTDTHGRSKEMVRTTGRTFVVHITPPRVQKWV